MLFISFIKNKKNLVFERPPIFTIFIYKLNDMKTFYTILSALMISSLSFSQSNVKIVSSEDGVNYAGQTATIAGEDFTIGDEFYVINTGSATAAYNFAVIPLSKSNSAFIFQFCNDGGTCYNVDSPIGSFWIAPSSTFTVVSGDTTKIDIKMNTMGHSGTGNAMYYVLDGNNNKIDSVNVEFTSTVSVATEQEIPTFKIYPNPAKESVTIQGEALKNGGTVIFQNSLGQEVKRVHLSEMHTMINVNSLNKGVYFVSISDEKGTKSKVQRLIVQ